jgi:glycosyltransferase involved in cell wall biosynthesis
MTYEAVKSVLQQDEEVELVVLDDFYLVEPSVENLSKIDLLNEYLRSDNRVKHVSNKRLLPIQDNWNKAVSICSGRYIKLMGADDRMLPNCISKMHEMIRERPRVFFHGHLAHVINSSGFFIRKQQPYGNLFSNRTIIGAEALKAKLRQQVRFKEPACNFYLKSAWEKVGGYDKKFRFTFDIHFNSKLMANTPSMLWNEYLVELRRHQSSDGSQLPASMALAELNDLIEEIFVMLGSNVTFGDRLAAEGWMQYRVIELTAQRLGYRPSEAFKLLTGNGSYFLSNPFSIYWMLKLIFNRAVYGDVQQD